MTITITILAPHARAQAALQVGVGTVELYIRDVWFLISAKLLPGTLSGSTCTHATLVCRRSHFFTDDVPASA